MHDRNDRSTRLPANAWTREFLHLLREQDEPETAGEADVAGAPGIEPLPDGGFAVLPAGLSLAHGHPPVACFERRSEALVAAATYPGTGRDAAYRLRPEPEERGFAVESRADWGAPVGFLAEFNQDWIESMGRADALARSPEQLATFLESVGPLALERAGAILAARLAAAR
jgi:hypothetical protein